MRKLYVIGYEGNSTRYQNLAVEVLAESKRDAVIDYVEQRIDLFPDEDDNIYDCDHNLVCQPDDETISYDGGYFFAVELNDE